MGLMKLYAVTFEDGETIEGTRYVVAPDLTAAAADYSGLRIERVELLGHVDVVTRTGRPFVQVLQKIVQLDDDELGRVEVAVPPPHPRGD